jgi:hypothetical protein
VPDAFVVDCEIASCKAVNLAEKYFAGSVVFNSLSNATVVSCPDARMLDQCWLYFSGFTGCLALRR